MSLNFIEVLNTIRDNASAEYQNRIPEATQTNIEEIRAAMIDDDNILVANEFTNALLNKVAKTEIITKVFKNKLKSLKKGTKPLGDTIEEVYNNFIKGEQFDGTGNTTALMGRKLPDVKTCYHRMNKQMKYPVTISRERLSKAFKSYENLESFYNSILQSVYNSVELDEFIHMKQLFKSAFTNNAIKKITVSDPLTTDGKEFIKTVKTVSGMMEFPSTEFNAYLTAQKTDKKPITTFSKKSEQVLIIDTATDVALSVDVLASIFNMSVAEFNDTRKIVIDVFPEPTMRAVLVDEQFFQVFDDLFTFKGWENPESLYMNYWCHTWQTLAYSILVNAVAFCVEGASSPE